MSWWPSLVSYAATTAWLGHLSAAQLPAPAPAVAFVDVAVLPMDQERVLEHQTVIVQDRRIAAVGPVKNVRVPRDAVRVDGKGLYLMPGLADMHVHVFQRQAQMPDRMEEILLAFLAQGITTVRDMHSGKDVGQSEPGGRSNTDVLAMTIKGQLAASQLVGPRVYTAGDPRIGEEGELVRESIVALRAHGHEFVKVDDRWPLEIHDSIKAVADSLGLRIAGHVPAESFGIEGALAAKWASIEHLMTYVNYLIGYTGPGEAVGAFDETAVDTAAWLQPNYQLDEARLAAIAAATRQAGVWNCPTLSRLEPHIIGPHARAVKRVGARYWEYDLRVVKALADAGAGLLLGTDMAGPETLFGGEYPLRREMELLRQAGLTPYQILESGTRNVARFLGVEDSGGTVAVGKWADLVLLSGNPLEVLHRTAAPVGVVIRGQWLPRAELEGRLQALEAKRRREEEERRRERKLGQVVRDSSGGSGP